MQVHLQVLSIQGLGGNLVDASSQEFVQIHVVNWSICFSPGKFFQARFQVCHLPKSTPLWFVAHDLKAHLHSEWSVDGVGWQHIACAYIS